MFWNKSKPKWSENPGCFERHLIKRMDNLLFPVERRTVTKQEIATAINKDNIEQELFELHLKSFMSDFKNIIGGVVTIKQASSLLRGIQDIIEEAAKIGGNAFLKITVLESIEDTLINHCNKLMPDGKELLGKAKSLSVFSRQQYLAQSGRKDTPMLEGEKIAALLSEDLNTIASAGEWSHTIPDFRPTDKEIKLHIEEAVKNDFDKSKANEILNAWFNGV
jgi:hypothetical protein